MLSCNLSLYVIVDPDATPIPLDTYVEQLLEAGVQTIQLRDKSKNREIIRRRAQRIVSQTKAFGARFFVNDYPELADDVGADGVHLGANDPNVHDVKNRFPHLIIGASARTPHDAQTAQTLGAHYLGCGPIWDASASKKDAVPPIGLQQLQNVVESVTLPVVGIGGVKAERVVDVLNCGAAGVAVIRATLPTQTDDVPSRVQRLLHLINTQKRGNLLTL